MLTRLRMNMRGVLLFVSVLMMGMSLNAQAQTIPNNVDTTRCITMVTDSSRMIRLASLYIGDGYIPIKVCFGTDSVRYEVMKRDSNYFFWVDSGQVIKLYGALEFLLCSDNNLVSLDVSGSNRLKYLFCGGNRLRGLDISQNDSLEDFRCEYGRLGSLDVSHNLMLHTIDCRGCELSELDVTHNLRLGRLVCYQNNLTSLDVTHNLALRELWVTNNELDSLDVSRNVNLEMLECNDNRLRDLDITSCVNLWFLNCSGNGFSAAMWDRIYCMLPDRSGMKNGEFETGANELEKLRLTNGSTLTNRNWVMKIWGVEETNANPLATGSYVCGMEVPISVSTFDASEVGAYGARLNGGIDYMYLDVDSCGYEWRMVGEEGYNRMYVGTRMVDTLLTGLEMGTDYEYRAFAELEDSVYYGEVKGFSTVGVDTTRCITMVADTARTIRFEVGVDGENIPLRVCVGMDSAWIVVVNYGDTLECVVDSGEVVKVYGGVTSLNCERNNLMSLDVSGNGGMQGVNCLQNHLTSLILGQQSQLQNVDARGNRLTSIDVSGCGDLRGFLCGSNRLTNLDVSGNLVLDMLECADNQFTTLDLSHNLNLTGLSCGWNPITSLDLTHNVRLTSVDCREISVDSLDVRQNVMLQDLICSSIGLRELDVTQNRELKWLWCYYNELDSLDLSQNVNLVELHCEDNELTGLDLSHNVKLRIADCTRNYIPELNLSQNVKLEWLHCGGNLMRSLDVSRNVALNNLACMGNPFSLAVWDELYCMLPNRVDSVMSGALEMNVDELMTLVLTNGNNLRSRNWGAQAWNDGFGDSTHYLVGTHVCGVEEMPVVTTLDASEVWMYDARLNGGMEYLYLDVDSCGYEWRMVGEEGYNRMYVGSRMVDTLLMGLEMGTDYEYRAFAELEDSVYYGEVKGFSTVDVDTTRCITMVADTARTIRFEVGVDGENMPLRVCVGTDSAWIAVVNYGDTLECVVDSGEVVKVYGGVSSLNCERNNLMSLDVSGNGGMRNLNCNNNRLVSLDLDSNVVLEGLDVSGNRLDSLNVGRNTELRFLVCEQNRLRSLDVSNNVQLESLNCIANQIGYLDMSHNLLLNGLVCGFNGMDSLDITQNVLLRGIDCRANDYAELDVTQNEALEILICSNNDLSELDVTQNRELKWLWCYYNEIDSLDVTQNVKLECLECRGNNLTELDLSQNVNLVELYCETNEIDSLDLSQNVKLKYLDCHENRLEELDLSGNVALLEVDCRWNRMGMAAWDRMYCSVADRSDSVQYGKICIFDNDNVAQLGLTNGGTLSAKNWQLQAYLYEGGWVDSTMIATGTHVCGVEEMPVVTTLEPRIMGEFEAMMRGSMEYLYVAVDSCGFEWRMVGEEVYNRVNVGSVMDSSLLSGLLPFSRYEYRAYAAMEDSVYYGEVVEFRTGLGRVMNVWVEEIEENGAVVKWNGVEGQSSWELKLMEGDGVYAAEDTIYQLVDLESEMEYHVAVRGKSEDSVYSEWSEWVEFVTLMECDDVDSVVVSEITGNTAKITWEEDEGQTSWEVAYGVDGTDVDSCEVVVVSVAECVLRGLTKDTDYDVYVRGVCGEDRYSEWSDEVEFETLDEDDDPEGIGDVVVDGEMRVYPNPTCGKVWVEVVGVEGEMDVVVVDVNGRLMWRGEMNGEGKIGVEGLRSGVYFVRVVGDDWMMVKRLVVR